MAKEKRAMRLADRPEFATKPAPLTTTADVSIRAAVDMMAERDYGSVFIVDDENKVIGVLTERDIIKRVVSKGVDTDTTPISTVMTANPRVATEDDDLLDWLRIMSNERFRRLPVVDADGRIKAVFTQGDFVSYTWPDLVYQAQQYARAQIASNFPILLIGGGIAVYTILMALVFSSMD
ncbi:CBS domain-containing protein [Pontivivens insulae]|uniref:Hypoxic response protein 1 n=1 Tax=Pontivivens insulae TaxID=1639689 RepID=A0A2R8A9K9_9RHOB|nr:CBS domain-containing protein [Pontivivens insulae]RED12840.1 CBS domain protein [Pontivivens insulae]SPF28931.1 Hypoxic response protein 1 [Pontivivens insulae]